MFGISSEDITKFTSRIAESKIIKNKGNNLPKFSVIIPTLNQGEFIEKTILSIINQGYPNTEIIIIDGGSEDNTINIIRKYESYIYYWESKPDKGQADAINKGFKISTGEFLCWQNSDDIFLPNAFFSFANSITENPDYDVYYSNIIVIDEGNKIKDAFKVFKFGLFFNLYDDIVVHNQAAFFRKEKIFEVGLLDETMKFCFDLDLVSKLMIFGAKFFPINKYLGAFRLHEQSKTSKILNIWKEERMKVIERYSKHTLNIPESLAYAICKILKTLFLIKDGSFDYIYIKLRKRYKRILGLN